MFDEIPIPILIVQDFLIISYNQQASLFFNIKPSKSQSNVHLKDIIFFEAASYEDPQSVFTPLFANCNAGNSPKILLQFFTSAGKRNWAEVTVSLYKNSAYLLCWQDVTHLKEKENELKKNVEDLQHAMKISKMGMWEVDLATNMVQYSPEIATIFGRFFNPKRKPTLSMREWLDRWINPKDKAAPKQALKRLIEKANPDELEVAEFRVKIKDEIRTVRSVSCIKKDTAGKIISWFGTSQDVTEQKRLEEKLKRSEEHLNLALNVSQMAVWESDMITDAFEITEHFSRIYGRPYDPDNPQFITQQNFFKWVYEEDQYIIENALRELQKSKEIRQKRIAEFRIIKEKEFRVIRTSMFLVRDSEGKEVRLFGTDQDITDQKRIEEQLRRSQQKLEFALKISKMAIWEFDLKTNKWKPSQQICHLYGKTYSSQYAKGITLNEFLKDWMIKEDRLLMKEEIQSLLDKGKGGGIAQLDFRIKKNGEIRMMRTNMALLQNERGEVTTLFGSDQDISDQKKVEEELKVSRQKLEFALDISNLCIFEIDPETQSWLMNKQIAQVFGRPFDPEHPEYFTQDQYFNDWIYEEDNEKVSSNWSSLIAGQENANIVEYRAMIKGKLSVIRQVTRINRDESGKITSVFGTSQDVTQQKKVEEELKLRQRQLEFALDISNLCMWEVNIDTNSWVMNKQIAAVFGKSFDPRHPKAVTQNQFINQWIYKEDRKRVHSFWKILLENPIPEQIEVLEYRAMKKGAMADIRQVSCLVREQDGRITYCFGTSQDVTQQKKVEEELKLRQRQLEFALDISNLCMWEVNIDTNSWVMNKQIAAVFGKSFDPRHPKTVTQNQFINQWIYKEDRNRVQAFWKELLENPIPEQIEVLEYRAMKKGALADIRQVSCLVREQDGRITYCFGTSQDVTELKKEEEALRVSQMKLEFALKITDLCMWEMDLEKNTFTVNKEIANVFGLSFDPKNPKTYSHDDYFKHWIYKEDREKAKAERDELLASKAPEQIGVSEYRILKFGDLVVIRQITYIARDKRGEIIRFFGTK